MNYSYEEPRVEQHCISVWGKEARSLCIFDDKTEIWLLKSEVKDWLREHKDLCNTVLSAGNCPEDDVELTYTFRFKTKDAAMLFKMRFQGMSS